MRAGNATLPVRNTPTRGWKRLYAERVPQADQGAALDSCEPPTMTDFEPPRLHAPRLADVLGRGVPEIELVRLQRQPPAEGTPPDGSAAVRAAILPHLDQVRAGETVAIGVGSRGIQDIPLVV